MPVYLCIGPLEKIETGEIWTTKHRDQLPIVNLDKLSALSADGEELELILKNIRNLPYTDHWLQVWFGDMARFIWRAIPGIPGMLSDSPKMRPGTQGQ